MKLVFCGQIFEKYSNTKFHENPSVEAELLHAEGRTDLRADRHAVASGRFGNFCERAHKVYLLRDFNWI